MYVGEIVECGENAIREGKGIRRLIEYVGDIDTGKSENIVNK